MDYDIGIIRHKRVIPSGMATGFSPGPPPFTPFAGAALDLNFALGAYWNGSSFTSDPTQYVSCSRASSATNLLATSLSGASFTTFAANVLRITPGLGLLIEPFSNNALLNSGAPATQTTASLTTGIYVLWVNGSGSATVSGGTATITGAGTAIQGSPVVFTVTVAGTVVVTVTGSLNQFQLESYNNNNAIGVTAAFPTSYIPTTGTVLSRTSDQITNNGGLLDTLTKGASGSCVALFTTYTKGDTGRLLIDASENMRLAFSSTSIFTATITRNTGTNKVDTVNTFTSAIPAKVGGSWGGGLSVVLNGGTVVTAAEVDGAMTSPSQIGDRPADDRSITGYMSRIALWNSKIADATLQGFTV